MKSNKQLKIFNSYYSLSAMAYKISVWIILVAEVVNQNINKNKKDLEFVLIEKWFIKS